jgi:hypothetical protein
MKERSQASLGSVAEDGIISLDVEVIRINLQTKKGKNNKHVIKTCNKHIRHPYNDLPLNYMDDTKIQIYPSLGTVMPIHPSLK